MLNSSNTAGEKSCADDEPPPDVSVREAKVKDIPRLVRIYREFMAHFEELDPMFRQDSSYWTDRSKDNFSDDLNNKDKLYILIEENGNLVGFIDIRISRRPDDYIIKKTGHIESVYIRPEHRKKGYGKLLLDRAMEWFSLKKVNTFTIGTLPEDKAARSFWKKMGFKEYLVMYRK